MHFKCVEGCNNYTNWISVAGHTVFIKWINYILNQINLKNIDLSIHINLEYLKLFLNSLSAVQWYQVRFLLLSAVVPM